MYTSVFMHYIVVHPYPRRIRSITPASDPDISQCYLEIPATRHTHFKNPNLLIPKPLPTRCQPNPWTYPLLWNQETTRQRTRGDKPNHDRSAHPNRPATLHDRPSNANPQKSSYTHRTPFPAKTPAKRNSIGKNKTSKSPNEPISKWR